MTTEHSPPYSFCSSALTVDSTERDNKCGECVNDSEHDSVTAGGELSCLGIHRAVKFTVILAPARRNIEL